MCHCNLSLGYNPLRVAGEAVKYGGLVTGRKWRGIKVTGIPLSLPSEFNLLAFKHVETSDSDP